MHRILPRYRWAILCLTALGGSLVIAAAPSPAQSPPQPYYAAPQPQPAAPRPAAEQPRPPLADTTLAGNQQDQPQAGSTALFYNFYVAGAGATPAAMYPVPFPTPPAVGHVYYTYQPLLPHEYLYPHYRQYYTYYGHWHGYGACHGLPSVTRTIVRYNRGTIRPLYLHRLHRPQVPAIPCGPHCLDCP